MLARVVQKFVGKRGEVQVVIDEELLGWHLFCDLDQRALGTERDVQGESGLGKFGSIW